MVHRYAPDAAGSAAFVMSKVVHLSSVHRRTDTRVFLRECRSLAAAGHDVSLVVADGLGDELRRGVSIIDVGRPSGRLARMVASTWRVFWKARSVRADIYHFHDPELMFAGLALQRRAKVVFDAHEDLPRQLLTKSYLGPRRRRWLAWIFTWLERVVVPRFDAVVAATPSIGTKFEEINDRTVVVNNFPMRDELASVGAVERRHVAYVGGITAIRGIREIVAAMEQTESAVRLQLAGRFTEPAVEAEVKAMPGWRRVDEHGELDRAGVAALLAESFAGIVAFHPLPNHVDAQPNKMFEYMSAGVAVIASDFPLWRDLVEGSGAGVCVDPLDPGALAAAIDALHADPRRSAELGAAGRDLVANAFNWSAEAATLVTLYSRLTA